MNTTALRSEDDYAFMYFVNEDDVVRIHTGNGAGYGAPRNRDKDAVRSDIKNGYVTPERAREMYGI